MSKIVILNRKKIQFYTILAVVVILAGAYFGWQQTKPTLAPAGENTQVIQLVTGEFTATSDSGKKLESYVFYPGTVIVHKGQPVELRISGVNGQSHPFVIEGLDVSGEIHKGKTTIVRFTPKEAGVYSIICQTHSDPKSGGPMVGYLVVQ
ncbi:cupredoxin domain-containing protein [Cohnella silvisoli]|uniref:Cupredoxin domain-containing protein n=1 Tax=Cohnella silvisoli TaxID=2873699 RepID=A0ABV1L362_9BACL|nr:cupredoxin domain-containing protein [Cohnella silvisoli]MCD9026004.1 cupredoxin domain-containing protein [Cohnella silvisoli]